MDPAALSDAGGWAVVVAMITALGIGFVRGWLVPGFVYQREVERGERAATQAERTADALERLVRIMDIPFSDDREAR